MKYYISGPMSGYADFNFPAFNKVEVELIEQGHTVINPARFFEGVEPPSWEECMKECLRKMADADALVLLPDWEKSRGATIEVIIAKGLGFKIFTLSGEEITDSLTYELVKINNSPKRPLLRQTINGWTLWENEFNGFPATKKYVTFHPLYDGFYWEQHDTLEEAIAFCTPERLDEWATKLL